MALSDAAMAPWLSWRAWIQEQVELTVPQRGEAVEGGQPAWFMESWSPSAPQPPTEVVAGLGLSAMAQGGILNKKVVGLRAWAGWTAGCPYLSSFPGPGTLFRGKVSAARVPGVREKSSSFPKFASQISWLPPTVESLWGQTCKMSSSLGRFCPDVVFEL